MRPRRHSVLYVEQPADLWPVCQEIGIVGLLRPKHVSNQIYTWNFLDSSRELWLIHCPPTHFLVHWVGSGICYCNNPSLHDGFIISGKIIGPLPWWIWVSQCPCTLSNPQQLYIWGPLFALQGLNLTYQVWTAVWALCPVVAREKQGSRLASGNIQQGLNFPTRHLLCPQPACGKSFPTLFFLTSPKRMGQWHLIP